MTKCKFWENRYIPIEYSLEKISSEEKYFSLSLITKGTAILEINGERCYVSAPALICANPDKEIEIIISKSLRLKTVFFSPDFINRNLSTERILSDDYKINCKLFDFPSFDLFYINDDIYKAIIPFEFDELPKIDFLFNSIIEQLDIQPDNMWSCRARMAVIRIFDYAANLYQGIFGVNSEEDTLVDCLLTYIEFNFEKHITIEDLCRLYNTNRTTLMSEFKRVTGKTINEFITDRRIDMSKQILAFTNISIEELSDKCGFSSSSYFTRAFKKKTGLSPSAYRNKEVRKRIEQFQK